MCCTGCKCQECFNSSSTRFALLSHIALISGAMKASDGALVSVGFARSVSGLSTSIVRVP